MTKPIPAAAVNLALAALVALPGAAAGRRHHRHRYTTHVMQSEGEQGTRPSSPAPVPLQAGTVTSFQSGTLIVTLNDGQVLAGKVNGATRIVCGTPPPVSTTPPQPPPVSPDRARVRSDATPGTGDSMEPGAPVPPQATTPEPPTPEPTAAPPATTDGTTVPGPAGGPADGPGLQPGTHSGSPDGSPQPGGGPEDGPVHSHIQRCGTDALTAGAAVHELQLIAAPQGERFSGLALIK